MNDSWHTFFQRNIDGQETEAKALRLVAEISSELRQGQKIFHGVHLTVSKLAALAKIFGTPVLKYEEDLVNSFNGGVIQLEMDTIIIDKNCIGLMEIKDKDNTSLGKMAVKQLHLRERILIKIFDIISADPKTPIKKIVYFGSMAKDKPIFNTDEPEIKILRDYEDKDGNGSKAKQLLINEFSSSNKMDGAVCINTRNRLIVALTFLRFVKVHYQVTLLTISTIFK